MKENYNILIIDDEPNNIELIATLLGKYAPFAFSLFMAKNSHDANALMQVNNFSIVFSDYKMPRNNGAAFLDDISNKKIQLVLCTAFDYHNFEGNFKQPVYFLQKPIDIDVFKTMISHIFTTIQAYEKDLIL